MDTFKESTVLNFGWMGIKAITNRLGLPFGNAGWYATERKKLVEGFRKSQLFNMGVIAPLWEEGFFRQLPSWLLNTIGVQGTAWEVGVSTSVLFALTHNFTFDEKTKKVDFSTNKLPVGQFIYGNYLWKAMRERGFSHALLAHSAINTEGYFLERLYYTLFPAKRKVELEKIRQDELSQTNPSQQTT